MAGVLFPELHAEVCRANLGSREPALPPLNHLPEKEFEEPWFSSHTFLGKCDRHLVLVYTDQTQYCTQFSTSQFQVVTDSLESTQELWSSFSSEASW